MTTLRCTILSRSADEAALSSFRDESTAAGGAGTSFPGLAEVVRATVEYDDPREGEERESAAVGRSIPLGFVKKDGTLVGGGILAVALDGVLWWSMFQLDTRYRGQGLSSTALAELVKFAGTLVPRPRVIRASLSIKMLPRVVKTYTTVGFLSTGQPHPDIASEIVYELQLPQKTPVRKARKKVVKKTKKGTGSPGSSVSPSPTSHLVAPTIVEPARDSTFAHQPPLPPTPRLASPELPAVPVTLPAAVASDDGTRRASSRTSLPPIQRTVSPNMASSDSESSLGSSPAPTPVPTPEPVSKVTVASRLIESEADLDAHLARLRANVTALMAVRGAVLWSPTQLRAVEQFDIDTVETLASAMSAVSLSDTGETPRASAVSGGAGEGAAQQAENDAVLWGDNEKPDNAKQLTKSQVDDIVNWNKKTRTSTLHDMTSIKPAEALGQLAWETLEAELDALRREEAEASSDSDESDSDDSDSITDAAELDLLHLSLGGRLTPRISRNRDVNPAMSGSRVGSRAGSGLAASAASGAAGDGDESPESSDRGSPSLGSAISGRGRNVSVINAGDFRRVTDDAIRLGIARLKPVAGATVADRSAPLIEPGTTVKTFDKSAYLTSIAVGKTKLKHVQEDAVHDASAPKLPSVVVPSTEDVHRMTEEVVNFFIDGGGLNRLRPVRAVSDRSAPVLEVEAGGEVMLGAGQASGGGGQRS
jgi:hypothetical protein